MSKRIGLQVFEGSQLICDAPTFISPPLAQKLYTCLIDTCGGWTCGASPKSMIFQHFGAHFALDQVFGEGIFRFEKLHFR